MKSLEQGLEALRKEVTTLVTIQREVASTGAKASVPSAPVSPSTDAGTSRHTYGSQTVTAVDSQPPGSGLQNTCALPHSSPALQILAMANHDDLDVTASKTVSDGRRYRDGMSEDLRPPFKRQRTDRAVGSADGYEEAFERCVTLKSGQLRLTMIQLHIEKHLCALLFRPKRGLRQSFRREVSLSVLVLVDIGRGISRQATHDRASCVRSDSHCPAFEAFACRT